MLQVSRDSNLKIPKKLEDSNGTENSIEDKVAVKQAIATAENKRFNKKELEESIENDNELEQVNKLPFNGYNSSKETSSLYNSSYRKVAQKI